MEGLCKKVIMAGFGKEAGTEEEREVSSLREVRGPHRSSRDAF